MISFGSKRTYHEWRWTYRHLRKVRVSRPLKIKSRKAGRRYKIED